MRHLSIFLGSPRARGNGTRLAEALAEGAREAGFEAAFLRLADLNLKGCTDCRRCWKQVTRCWNISRGAICWTKTSRR